MALAKAEVGILIALYNKFSYGRRACLSALKYTKRSIRLYVVDDASPYYDRQDWLDWRRGIDMDRLRFKHFGENRGLTRSWNIACTWAREDGLKYLVFANSDVLFTPGWEDGLIYHLEAGYALIGPVSNAPGVSNRNRQNVTNYFPGYEVTDDPAYLTKVAEYLRGKHSINHVVGNCDINGFFMMSKTDRLWQGNFDATHVFDPSKKMTGNEDELQRRWRRNKWQVGFVPSSFIFHYRAVSRGSQHKHKGWYRIDDINKPV